MGAIVAAGAVILIVWFVLFSGGNDDRRETPFIPGSNYKPRNAPAAAPESQPETFTVSAGPSPGSEAPFGAQSPFSVVEAGTLQQSWAGYLNLPVEQENSSGMKLRLIPPGRFRMGSTLEEIELVKHAYPTISHHAGNDAGPELNPHQVTISRPIYCAVTEVTIEQFAEFVAATGYVTDAEQAGNKPQ